MLKLGKVVPIADVERAWFGDVEVPSKRDELARYEPFEAWTFDADDFGDVWGDFAGVDCRLREGVLLIGERDDRCRDQARYLSEHGVLLAPPILYSAADGRLRFIDGKHRAIVAFDEHTGAHRVYVGRLKA